MALNLESYSQKGYEFIKEVAIALGNTDDTGHASRVLVAVLHALRDMITPEESLHFIAQLPLYIKGVYVDQWKISGKQKNIRTMDEFLEDIRQKCSRTAGRDFGDDETTQQKVEAVFKVLQRHVSQGEIEDIKTQLPQPLVELWERQQTQ